METPDRRARSNLGKTVWPVLYAKSETDKIKNVECPIVWNHREKVLSNLGKTVRAILTQILILCAGQWPLQGYKDFYQFG